MVNVSWSFKIWTGGNAVVCTNGDFDKKILAGLLSYPGFCFWVNNPKKLDNEPEKNYGLKASQILFVLLFFPFNSFCCPFSNFVMV